MAHGVPNRGYCYISQGSSASKSTESQYEGLYLVQTLASLSLKIAVAWL